MVISTLDNMRALFENIKSLGFFGRLFGWRRILLINSAAVNELNTINNELNSLYEQNRQIQNQLRTANQDMTHQKSLLSDLRTDHDIPQEFEREYDPDPQEHGNRTGIPEGIRT